MKKIALVLFAATSLFAGDEKWEAYADEAYIQSRQGNFTSEIADFVKKADKRDGFEGDEAFHNVDIGFSRVRGEYTR